MKKLALMVVSMLLTLSGCIHVISDESRNLVDPSISFGNLRQAPDSFAGKYVMFGGFIAGVKNAKDLSELEVVQANLDGSGYPDITDHYSGGRFLATTPAFLDPMVYRKERGVTIVGEVKGTKVMPLGKIEYTYPVVLIREIRVFTKAELLRNFYDYPPGYYYDPFWYPYPFWRYYPYWGRYPYWW
jgi:outer membrane lipoprotein